MNNTTTIAIIPEVCNCEDDAVDALLSVDNLFAMACVCEKVGATDGCNDGAGVGLFDAVVYIVGITVGKELGSLVRKCVGGEDEGKTVCLVGTFVGENDGSILFMNDDVGIGDTMKKSFIVGTLVGKKEGVTGTGAVENMPQLN